MRIPPLQNKIGPELLELLQSLDEGLHLVWLVSEVIDGQQTEFLYSCEVGLEWLNLCAVVVNWMLIERFFADDLLGSVFELLRRGDSGRLH